MEYRAMQLDCYCGTAPERILEVGFTSERNMVVHYWCASCNRVLFKSHSLEECLVACPAADTEAQVQSAADDARFLESLGIAAP